ncbi:hypothetical protein [Mycobacterium intracellulare]|nr:hypothetical protein [Mycobacterium intracellulare]MCA2357577.1 hypothetical protein [Mycobacterium intracellulare]MCA2366393.1 hypothetical protein [Mycobacterium intracellulare]UGT98455.1 hypothetical protein LTQ55_07730 [Mycobacterium intracellulare]UQB99242.1 hypothetical protein KN246_10265 [Mycobacterium intracellulare]
MNMRNQIHDEVLRFEGAFLLGGGEALRLAAMLSRAAEVLQHIRGGEL